MASNVDGDGIEQAELGEHVCISRFITSKTVVHERVSKPMPTMDEAVAILEPESMENNTLVFKQESIFSQQREDTISSAEAVGTPGGDPETEAPLARQRLAALKEKLGEEHPEALKAMMNLGVYLSKLHRDEEAEPLKHRVLEISNRSLGADHPQSIIAMSHLALTLSKLGKHQECLDLKHKRQKILECKLKAEHPAVLASVDALVHKFSALGRHAEVEKLIASL